MSSAPLFALATGEVLGPRRHRVDQQLIDLYARVSGDHNPLHTDPEFAKTTHFGRTIAHGMMTLAFISAAMEAWAGRAWTRGGSVDVTFLAPVFPGDEVAITAEIVPSSESGHVACRLTCTASGRSVLSGEARVPAPQGDAA